MRLYMKRFLSLVLSITIALPISVVRAEGTAVTSGQAPDAIQTDLVKDLLVGVTYREYLEKYNEASPGKDTVVIKAVDYAEATSAVSIYQQYDGIDTDSLYMSEEGFVDWQFEISDSGMYNINLDYYPIQGKENDIERIVYIDGEIPFNQAKYITLSRIWSDVEGIKQDKNGNDIRPKQQETPEWRNTYLYDSSGHFNEPLSFYFEKGVHTLRFESVREPMLINQITVTRAEVPVSYAEAKKTYQEKGYVYPEAQPIKIQAESSYQKSDFTLYPSTDRNSAITEPQDSAKVKLNCISGAKYKLPGQWITWKFNVEKDGLYKIALRYNQNILTGMYSSRKLLLDGKVPFQEAMNLRFKYTNEWIIEVFGNNDEPFEFYLTEGEHELTLEVTLGDLATTINDVNNSLYVLNDIYRKVLMITGAEPDIYRDYSFERLIPGVIESMGVQAQELKRISDNMAEFIGGKGEQMAILDKVYYQLNLMHNDPELIARTFKSYKDNIAALATWILTVSEQPMSIDYIYITPVDQPLPRGEANLIETLAFEFSSFFMSFFVDYSSLGLSLEAEAVGDTEPVVVWLTSGRDQVNILREMINDTFTPETNIGVDLKLVDANTLLPSVLAGIGPDVALGNTVAAPIQYAVRNAVLDLNSFSTYPDVAKRFHSSALASYEFNEKVYALPETQIFPMLFYRKDIFAELGLRVPDTWEEFYQIIPELQKNNMEIGFPPGLSGLQIFLYQKGGSLYNDDLSRSTLDQDLTVDAFQQLCELFTTYKFPRDFDFANRFRTGQMPLGVADYTTYNQLIAFAPEIKGLWEFVPLPGTVMADDSINRAAASTGTYVVGGTSAMILKDSANPENAWRFLDWWTRADNQARFGQEMEAVLGKAAKQATANIEAIQNMPWTKSEYDNLMTQWNQLVGTPEVPGGYHVSRSVEFATRTAYTTGDGEALLDYFKAANEEITRKRKEFGLEQ